MKSQKPQRKKLPNILSSEQWQSESSVGFAALVGDGSPSGSGSGSGSGQPPDPCTGTPPASVPLEEFHVLVVLERPETPPGAPLVLARTSWLQEGFFEFGVYCDGARKVWTCRITTAWCQQAQRIGPPVLLVTDDAIDAAFLAAGGCATLAAMKSSLLNAETNPATSGEWLPDGFLLAHENVHRNHNSASASRHFDELRSDVEAIALACNDFSSSYEAVAAMAPTIDAALARYYMNLREDFVTSARHEPPGDFLAAQIAAVAQFLQRVLNAYELKGCP